MESYRYKAGPGKRIKIAGDIPDFKITKLVFDSNN